MYIYIHGSPPEVLITFLTESPDPSSKGGLRLRVARVPWRATAQVLHQHPGHSDA